MSKVKKICRACLLETGEMRSLFATGTIMGVTTKLAEVMLACADLKIEKDDGLPQQICIRCIHQVSRAFSFRKQCERNQEILLERLNEGEKTSNSDLDCESKLVTFTSSIDDSNKNHSVGILKNEDVKIEIVDHPEQITEVKPAINKTITVTKEKENIKTTPGLKLHKCKLCGKLYRKIQNLKLHFMEEHNNTTPQPKTNLKCSLCNKVCRTQEQMKRHMNIHETGKPFKCDLCPKSFQQRAAFVAHTYSHTGERPFLCTECGKAFKQNSELKIHMRMHLDLRPYSCDICGKAYRNSSLFSIHKRVHSGERPFACTFCDKKFISSSCLKNHVMIHTGEKPYTCDYCGRSFNRSNALNIHRKIHTGERPHVCTVCGKGFIQAHCLQSHMNTHKSA